MTPSKLFALTFAAIIAVIGCGTDTLHADKGGEAPTKAHRPNQTTFPERLDRIETSRARLAARLEEARSPDQRRAVLSEASAFVQRAIVDEIFPAWMDTPWGLGRKSTARMPHEPGMTVGCSYFVTSVLENAGLKLQSRYKFAQAPALHIQRSLAPAKRDLHRYTSIPPQRLSEHIEALGQGLYLIGLNNHVGFVVVKKDGVRFVHASYTGAQRVTDEKLAEAKAIANSQPAGYFVTPLFQDDRLVEMWLKQKTVPFKKG